MTANKICILFVDDQPLILRGIRRMLRDMRQIWDLHFVESGTDALKFLREHGADVIISDMRMPVMDGAALLKLVRYRNPQTVRMVLSGFSEKETLMSSAPFIHQYLSKPIDSDQIKRVIEDSMERLSHVEDTYLKTLVIAAERLPVNPLILKKLQDKMTNENWSLDEVSDIIWHDPAMTVMILKLVNGSFFGIGEPTVSVKRAASELGRETLATLINSSGLGIEIPDSNKKEDYAKYWKKSLYTAELARLLIRHHKKTQHEENEVYTAALLHNIGELLSLHSSGRDIWAEDLELAGFILLDIWGIPGREQRNVAGNCQLEGSSTYELISKAEYLCRITQMEDQHIKCLENIDGDLLSEMRQQCQKAISAYVT
ncbi:MAG: HDOD domain-containing protein [Lentisphaeraceae bacterium]|nr:HDOD domain-containing protein [Lentisphaeraceae bacterium]